VIELVLGGARSGKSRYAEQRGEMLAQDRHYVATAAALDDEMQARIQHHQVNRPACWVTHEESLQLAAQLKAVDAGQRVILVDCLTLWLSNLLLHEDKNLLAKEKQALLAVLPVLQADIVLVSNEVGQGIVPIGEINRRFVDEAGWLHQAIAAIAQKVTFVTAGLPQCLKNEM
jgi:adenosylcobinamide kinase/adenosylcobinamide-phosphate guanylyltransferase